MKSTLIECRGCGKPFRKYPSNSPGLKFCSFSCRAEWRERNARESFASKLEVNADGCWLWTGTRNKLGYGVVMKRGRLNLLAHRFSYEIHHGPIPEGLCVLHHCDVPSCVNPEHIYAGTHAQNMADMNNRGRQVAHNGTKNGRAKLTDKQVRRIRTLLGHGFRQRDLAEAFNVSKGTIYFIGKGTTWRHVK